MLYPVTRSLSDACARLNLAPSAPPRLQSMPLLRAPFVRQARPQEFLWLLRLAAPTLRAPAWVLARCSRTTPRRPAADGTLHRDRPRYMGLPFQSPQASR